MIEVEVFEQGIEEVVFLHEGLGSLSTVRDFVKKLPYKVTAYSRYGYGKSSIKPLPWPITYMHDEAEVLKNFTSPNTHLIGHSDGASIAAIYASRYPVKSLTLIAPHFVVEDISIKSIAEAKIAYEQGNLREKLAKHHQNPDNAFYGWNDSWLNTDFHTWTIEERLENITAPVMIIQGAEDQYGTMRQIEVAHARIKSPLQVHILEGVKHNPMREAEGVTLDLIKKLIAG